MRKNKPLDPPELYRLMQQYRLTVRGLSRLIGYPMTHVKTWLNGTQNPPVFLRTVIENQDKYCALLPREFRAAVSARSSAQRGFQRPLPKLE